MQLNCMLEGCCRYEVFCLCHYIANGIMIFCPFINKDKIHDMDVGFYVPKSWKTTYVKLCVIVTCSSEHLILNS